MKRLVVSLIIAAVAILAISSVTLAQATPEFKLGFKALADQIPAVVGQPLENEHWGANGDSLQQTTTGLMVWRKADNWTAFTNGSRTWVNLPDGVRERGNDERFPEEATEPQVAPVPEAAAPVAAQPAAGLGTASVPAPAPQSVAPPQPTAVLPTPATPTAIPGAVQNRRLDNGTILKDGRSGTRNELTIENGQRLDGVATLAGSTDQAVISVYVRGDSSYTLTGIPNGSYGFYFTLGEDWDNDSGRFTRNVDYSKAQGTMVFRSSSTSYTGGRITLHSFAWGNTDVSPVDPTRYPSVR